MNENKETEIRRFLKENVPAADLELRRDLWPAVFGRMEKGERHVPWFDWVLLGAATACVICLPQMIPMLLYHL
jgi:hypothetical protein